MNQTMETKRWTSQDLFDRGVMLMEKAELMVRASDVESAKEYRDQAMVFFDMWKTQVRGSSSY